MEVYSRLLSLATREEPAEYLEWGVCTDCGATLDLSDIPDQAEVTEGENEPPMRGIPHEFYD
jgi:hypothetical protein